MERAPSPSHRFAAGPSLSRRARGKIRAGRRAKMRVRDKIGARDKIGVMGRLR